MDCGLDVLKDKSAEEEVYSKILLKLVVFDFKLRRCVFFGIQELKLILHIVGKLVCL